MKLSNLLESSVTDLGAFRDKREEEKRKDLNRQIRDARMKRLDQITMSVAAAIDQLVEDGMPQQQAQRHTAQHLENLIENISLMGTK